MTRKNTFQPGDYAVYFEINSKVPETEPFKFLEKKHYKVKTQKYTFGGKGNFISQGLLMSLDDFKDEWGRIPAWLAEFNLKVTNASITKAAGGEEEVVIPYFLTKELGVTYSVAKDNKRKSNITKYDKMYQRHLKLFKKHKILRKIYKYNIGKKILFILLGRRRDTFTWPVGRFPGVSKTDQERVENMTWVLEDKTPYIKTLKVDGTSGTFILEKKPFKKYEYYVCSRNVRMINENQSNYHADDENVYWEVSTKYHIQEFLQDLIERNGLEWAAIQGEIAGVSEKGRGIQGDPHKLKELRFFGFHLTDSDKGRYSQIEAKKLCNEYGIEWVPIIDDNYILPNDLTEFKNTADGKCEIEGSSGLREGYVYYNTKQPSMSFKNVSNEYLLGQKN